MTKQDKIEKLLTEAGFKPAGDFLVIRGPKVKSDICECWNVNAIHAGKLVTIHSGHTMTQLVKGLVVVLNSKRSWLRGNYIAEPKGPN